MSIPTPHFLLYSEARRKQRQGQWRFVLHAADGSATLEAEDQEPEIGGERLELLAVIRGLEALDQPSRVTLFTASKYVSRGMAYGLEEWRRNGWNWECFGEMVPVKNRDLWQRLDRALNYHTIEFRVQRSNETEAGGAPFSTAPSDALCDMLPSTSGPSKDVIPCLPHTEKSAATVKSRKMRSGRWLIARLSRSMREHAESWKLRCGQFGTALLPKPWLQ